jgi:prevent-host-death family protein
MKHLAVSRARAELPTLIDSLERTLITRNGEPAAVLMNIDDYRAMQAINRLARDPERLRRILDDHAKVQRGELEEFPELDLDRLRREDESGRG